MWRCKNGSSTVTSKASTTIGKMNRPLKLKYAGPVTAANKTLSPHQSQETASASYPALSEGLTFSTEPWERDLEIVGPVKARLFVSSSTRDMDIFATLCALDPSGEEMTFIAAPEPKAPVTQGWLRVSQRKLDPQRSIEYLAILSS